MADATTTLLLSPTPVPGPASTINSVNDGQVLTGLISDLKFMSYLYNSLLCLYGMRYFRRNQFLMCATASSLCGVVGTFLVALHNDLRGRGQLSLGRYVAILVPIELTWGSSEFLAAITTYFKLKMLRTNRTARRRNRTLLITITLAYAGVRFPILLVRLFQKSIWNQQVYYAYMVYYLILVAIDTVLTTVLIKDTMQVQRDLHGDNPSAIPVQSPGSSITHLTPGGQSPPSTPPSSRPFTNPFSGHHRHHRPNDHPRHHHYRDEHAHPRQQPSQSSNSNPRKLQGFLDYTVFGSVSRVIYMNIVMLCIALTTISGVIFLIDLLLTKNSLGASQGVGMPDSMQQVGRPKPTGAEHRAREGSWPSTGMTRYGIGSHPMHQDSQRMANDESSGSDSILVDPDRTAAILPNLGSNEELDARTDLELGLDEGVRPTESGEISDGTIFQTL